MSEEQALQKTGQNGRMARPASSAPSQAIDRHEKALMQGDLSKLSPQERKEYYSAVCESVGLNPMTKPLEYIWLNGELKLYANKTATNQLRKKNGVSIIKLEEDKVGDLFIVRAYAKDASGRTDVDEGGVDISRAKGEALANARMKAITKAKRRVTLSICGLGYLDKTEVDDIPDEAVETVEVDHETGEIKTSAESKSRKPSKPQSQTTAPANPSKGTSKPSGLVQREDEEPRWKNATPKTKKILRKLDLRLLDQDPSDLDACLSKSKEMVQDWQNGSWAQRYGWEIVDAHLHRLEYLEDERDDKYPSQSQIDRIYAIASSAGTSEDAIDYLVESGWGFRSKKEIPSRLVYETICFQVADAQYASKYARDPNTKDMFDEADTGEGAEDEPESGRPEQDTEETDEKPDQEGAATDPEQERIEKAKAQAREQLETLGDVSFAKLEEQANAYLQSVEDESQARRIAIREVVRDFNVEPIPVDFPHRGKLASAGILTLQRVERRLQEERLQSVEGIGRAYADEIGEELGAYDFQSLPDREFEEGKEDDELPF